MGEKDLTNAELLQKILNVIKTEGEQIRHELKQEIQTENKKIIKKIDLCLNRVDDLDQKYKQLESKCIYYDRQLRKNNLLIFGFKIDENVDFVNVVLEKIRELLNLDVTIDDINNIYPIKTGNNRAIKVEFVSYLKKNLIFKNCYKLKGTDIYFTQDLSYQDRLDAKILRKHLNNARSHNYFAKINGRTLIVNEKVFTLEALKKMDLAENILRADRPITPPEIERLRPNSAPETPITYYKDTLDLLAIPTPLSTNVKNINVITDESTVIENAQDEQEKEEIKDTHAKTERQEKEIVKSRESDKKDLKKKEDKNNKSRNNSTSSNSSITGNIETSRPKRNIK